MLVKLIDGTEVDSYSEAWRAETEARAVCMMPTLAERRKFMAVVEQKRGKEAALQLRLHVFRVWDHMHGRPIVPNNDAA
jgi:hypothetical protein